MRKYVTLVLVLPILLVAGARSAQAQFSEADCATRTGQNATLIFPSGMSFDLAGASLEAGDVVTATSADGRCVGRLVWTSAEAHALSIWGDDAMTDAVDGMAAGEPIRIQVYDASAAKLYDRIDLRYAQGDGAYSADGVLVASAATVGGEVEVRLAARVMLQGSYVPAQKAMSTALLETGALPLQHPYASPLYDGTPLEYDTPMSVSKDFFTQHPDIVDYVLVELRTGIEATSTVAKRPALLKSKGDIIGLDGSSTVAFDVEPGKYYVIVRHRNHLPVMSAAPVDFTSGSASYDFSTKKAQAYGSDPMVKLASGIFGLYAGDADGNGQIQNSDKNSYWWPSVGKAGYEAADFNLNGQVQNDDKNLFWWANIGRGVAF